MQVEISMLKTTIWEWIYMRKAVKLHLLCFWMVVVSRPLSFMAIAPSTHREWLQTWERENALFVWPRAWTARWTMAAMSLGMTWPLFACKKKRERGEAMSWEWARMWWMRWASNQIGQVSSLVDFR